MSILLKISLILLVSFLQLTSVPLAHSSPMPSTNVSDQHSTKPDVEAKSECFSKLDIAAIEDCKSLIMDNQSDSKIWNRIGHIYYGLEQYEASYLSFKYAVSLDPKYAMAWANVCAALNKNHKHEEALNACDESLNISSELDGSTDEKILALNNKAIALYSLARYQDSISVLDHALSIKPNAVHIMLNRTIILHILDHRIGSSESDLKS